jgi:hypothetical protein
MTRMPYVLAGLRVHRTDCPQIQQVRRSRRRPLDADTAAQHLRLFPHLTCRTCNPQPDEQAA